MNRIKRFALGIIVVGFTASAAWAEIYTIDPVHSSAHFIVRHVVGRVVGRFDKISGSFNYVPDKVVNLTTEGSIDVTSINTGIEKRDEHLRSADFFEVQKYPTIAFKSTKVTDVNGNKAKLHGNLTMHGVTRPVVLDLEMRGVAKNPMGEGTVAGATATGKLNRLDFSIGSNLPGPLAAAVGNEIDIRLEIEAIGK